MATPLNTVVLPVRLLLLASSLALVFAAGSVRAQTPTPPVQAAQVSPAANEAANVVNAFMAALAGNRLEVARQLMTPDAVVIANGQVIGTRDAYIDGAAKGDAAGLAQVQRELLRRDATANGNLGVVLSEKRITPTGAQPGGPAEIVTETMLLARDASGWKIAHIHWSNRHAR